MIDIDLSGLIICIAGVNGSGKSSVVASYIRKGPDGENFYFNPDEVARSKMSNNSDMTQKAANSAAWHLEVELLNTAIKEGKPFTFESTLGGNTITQILFTAISMGTPVSIQYVGLDSVEKNLSRVAHRVSNGGHDIPEKKVRDRYTTSRFNLIHLIEAGAWDVAVWDNSEELNSDGKPDPKMLFHLRGNQFIKPPKEDTPEWAKSVAAAALCRVMGA